MTKRAQSLIVILWILAILTVLAISAGHRTSLALRLSRFQLDRLKALYLAKAGINRAIAELDKDERRYDALNDSWADNEKLFKNIMQNDGQGEYAAVGYTIMDGDYPVPVFGVIDEERKINVNTASAGLLAEVFKKIGAFDPQGLADQVAAWRGDIGGPAPDYGDLGYSNKGSPLANLEELILVRDIDLEIYDGAKDLLTVWGGNKVNINTCSQDVLVTLIEYSRQQVGNNDNDPGDLAARITQARPVASFSELDEKLKAQRGLSSAQINVLNGLSWIADFKSTCFSIEARGTIEKKNMTTTIVSVFDRVRHKIIYWHEN